MNKMVQFVMCPKALYILVETLASVICCLISQVLFGGSKPVNWFSSKFLQKYTHKPYEYHLLYNHIYEYK